jgi:peptidoglycan/xylan/chitin deacetylase (PgdA/CDA1 family)
MVEFGKKLMRQVLYALRINWLLVRIKDHSIILGLHRVINSDSKLLNRRIEHMNPQMLEKIIQYLLFLGYKFVTLSELMCTKGVKAVAITFDDGFKDLYQNAYPILKKYSIPFTVFLTTSTVGSKELLWQHRLYAALDKLTPEKQLLLLCKYGFVEYNNRSLFEILNYLIHSKQPGFLESMTLKIAEEAGLTITEETKQAGSLYLDRSQIEEMLNNGLEVHAHGHMHWSLPMLNREQTEAEIDNCLTTIEGLICTEPVYYAPAFGMSNCHLQSVVRMRNIKAIIGTNSGLIGPESKNYELPRIMTVDVLGLSVKLTRLLMSNLFPLDTFSKRFAR